ncbi:HSP20-like chaperone [Gaertneriomyces semiglobifer]|nr:HSP20-like chaperone [Gaertneriomyces semiglobifer]
MPVCTNKGCGKTFNEADNSDTACEYHSGAPVFHEGLKSWSCCSKKVTDFDDFLKIPPCTVGRHSTAAPEQPKPVQESTPAPSSVGKDGTESYGTPAVVAAEQFVPAAADNKPVVKEEDLHDAADDVITPGTKCKRRACGHEYVDAQSRDQECVFHPGEPVFHEGSKGYSCCSRKVLEFDEFLKIKGCKTGKHRFTDVLEVPEKVECRHDWYQTPQSVIISIFAKKVNKEKTSVTFAKNELKVDVHFLDGKMFQFHTPLSQPIDPEASKFEILSTKIELALKKANGISWASIEPNTNVMVWTTFGTTGTVGTVGGKEAIVAQDVPLHLLTK